MALALVGCAAAPEPDLPAAMAAIERDLDRLEDQGLAGQVMVQQADRNLLERGLGAMSPGDPRPITLDAVMPLASVSKPFTASAALALAADGRIDLNDPLGRYLDGLSQDWREVPIHALLTHTAGLPAEIFNPAYAGPPRFEPVARDELIRRVSQFSPDHPPGTRFHYSNVGYNLAAAVVEVATGQALETFLQQRLLAPVGIEGLGLLETDWRADELVSGRRGTVVAGHHLDQPRLDDGLGWHSRGSGDLLARPAAMVTWWQTLRDRIWLPEPWMRDFLTAQVEQADGSGYGFGLEFHRTRQGLVIGHTGSDLDFSVDWSWFVDHDLLIYVVLADSRWQADELVAELARRLIPHL